MKRKFLKALLYSITFAGFVLLYGKFVYLQYDGFVEDGQKYIYWIVLLIGQSWHIVLTLGIVFLIIFLVWLYKNKINKQPTPVLERIIKLGVLIAPFVVVASAPTIFGYQVHINSIETNNQRYYWSYKLADINCCAFPEYFYTLWECDQFGIICQAKNVTISDFAGEHGDFQITYLHDVTPSGKVVISSGAEKIELEIP